MIGVFWQLVFVVVDFNCLKILLKCEFVFGLVEVIKYGVILDGEFFSWLENNIDVLLVLDDIVMVYCICCCCELKVEVVVVDECEIGLCVLFNFGYIFGYVIEVEMGYGNWLYGEVVVVGMVMVVCMFEWLGQFCVQDIQCIIDLFKCVGLLVCGLQEMSVQVYLFYMMCDKKVLVGEMWLVFLFVIGSSELCGGVLYDVVFGVIVDIQQV